MHPPSWLLSLSPSLSTDLRVLFHLENPRPDMLFRSGRPQTRRKTFASARSHQHNPHNGRSASVSNRESPAHSCCQMNALLFCVFNRSLYYKWCRYHCYSITVTRLRLNYRAVLRWNIKTERGQTKGSLTDFILSFQAYVAYKEGWSFLCCPIQAWYEVHPAWAVSGNNSLPASPEPELVKCSVALLKLSLFIVIHMHPLHFLMIPDFTRKMTN